MVAFDTSRGRRVRLRIAMGAVALTSGLWLASCGNKLEDKECQTIRGESFTLLNEAHHCNSDADCRLSDWPGCEKPISVANYDKIKPSHDKFAAGQCPEPEQKCREAPVTYCKQGLCTFREEGTPGAAATPPAGGGDIKIE